MELFFPKNERSKISSRNNMKPVYKNFSEVENLAKEQFFFRQGIMMENAAAALEKSVLEALNKTSKIADGSFLQKIIIVCGAGNNGADGLALARRLCPMLDVKVLLTAEPKTEEAKMQYKTARAIGVDFINFFDEKCSYSVVVDCMFGTGFHGELDEKSKKLIQKLNQIDAFKIACDVPSGLDKDGFGGEVVFCADETVCMGAIKLAHLSDFAKDFTGKLTIASLGICEEKLIQVKTPDAMLLEEKDIVPPERKKKNVHKGNFGHLGVAVGEKPGAAAIAGTSALCFGCGLVTCVQFEDECKKIIMTPELMVSNSFPENTNVVLLGSGLGRDLKRLKEAEKVLNFLHKMKSPAAVLDADFFYQEELLQKLERLDSLKNARILLTPHPKEFYNLIKECLDENVEFTQVVQNRFLYVQMFGKKFKNLVLVAKGAVTYIVKEDRIFICDGNAPSLAKAGSGDVLAGMCAALLAQGYSDLDAARTAVYLHAKAGRAFLPNYACTPLSLANCIAQI